MSHRDYMVHVRMEPEMRQWLRERAWNEKTTMTRLVVGIISNEMETEKAPDPALESKSDASTTTLRKGNGHEP